MVPSDHDAGKAHAEGPEDQQDPERDGQDQVVEEELGEHGRSAGVPSWERVGVHGQVVQQAGGDVVRALPLGQLLQTGHNHDVQEQGYKRTDEEGKVRDRSKVKGNFHGRTFNDCWCL